MPQILRADRHQSMSSRCMSLHRKPQRRLPGPRNGAYLVNCCCLFEPLALQCCARVTANLVEGVHSALFRRTRRQMSSHIGGRGSPTHSDLVKDFFVMLMNFSFENTGSLAGMLQLIRYELLLRSCLDIRLLLSILASGRYFYGTFSTTPQEFNEATQQGLRPVRYVEMREAEVILSSTSRPGFGLLLRTHTSCRV